MPRTLVAFLFLALVGPARAGDVMTDDAYVLVGKGKSLGTKTSMVIQDGKCNAYLKWDLSNLPPGSGVDIEMATVRLWVSKVKSGGQFDVRPVLEAWDEQTLKGDVLPLVDPPVVAGVAVTSAHAGNFLMIDITSLVRDWIDGVVPNNGLALIPVGGQGINFTVDSKENGKTAREPQLDLIRANPPAPFVSSVAVQSSNTITDIAMTGMAITPGPGNYVVHLSARFDATGAGNDQAVMSLYLDGVQVSGSERQDEIRNDTHESLSTQVVLTGVTAGQTIEGRWRTVEAKTLSVLDRTLTVIKVR